MTLLMEKIRKVHENLEEVEVPLRTYQRVKFIKEKRDAKNEKITNEL